MNKRGQLGIIEFKYFIMGLIIGLIIMFVLAGLSCNGVLPFKFPWVCA
ncbi:hypothetical protein HOI26_05710 [Candidatus Woesearchaeota archaeon]|nr:hypothetical protein [Candidatus Woesearchaeota archaeon]MBT5740563.1 hypothetical protein [Candidatus Woesearchaeota archaeon]